MENARENKSKFITKRNTFTLSCIDVFDVTNE